MGVVAFLDGRRGCARLDNLAARRPVVAVENLNPVPADDGPVTLVEISDALGPRRHCKRVGSKVILALAIADGERRPHPRTDDQVGMVAEQERNRKGPGKPRKYRRDRILRQSAALDLSGN